MGPKWPAIDILKLYTGKHKGFEDDTPSQTFDDANIDASKAHRMLKGHDKWNRWLRRCLKYQDLDDLIKVRYGLQVGMANLVKAKLTTPAVCEMFVRWTSSIEKTARQIIKRKSNITHAIAKDFMKAHAEKKRIDNEFEKFLKDSSY